MEAKVIASRQDGLDSLGRAGRRWNEVHTKKIVADNLGSAAEADVEDFLPATPPANLITNEMLVNVLSGIIKGRKTAEAGPVEDLTVSDLIEMLQLGSAAFTETSDYSQTAFSTIRIGGSPDIVSENTEDILTLVAGDGIGFVVDAEAKSVVIKSNSTVKPASLGIVIALGG